MEHITAFQALADPTRRRIVETLRGGEKQVNDVVSELCIRQSGVSRHLRILLDAGFVRVRADAQRRMYSLRPEPFRELDDWLGGFRGLWEARLDRFGKALEAKRRAGDARPEPSNRRRRATPSAKEKKR